MKGGNSNTRGFAQAMQFNMQKNVLQAGIKGAIRKEMTEAKEKRSRKQTSLNQPANQPRKKTIFETLLVRSLF